MKALEQLRLQLIKDYPGDTPVFGKAPSSPEEIKFLFEDIVIPAFESISKALGTFHFTINIRTFTHVLKLKIADGCSFYSLSIKTTNKNAAVTLLIQYRDYSVNSQSYELRSIFEEKYDLSKTAKNLPEELIITIFTDTFMNRKEYLKKSVGVELNDIKDKAELLRERRRSKLIELRLSNEKYDPEDEFKKYLESPDHTEMLRWLDMTYASDEDLM